MISSRIANLTPTAVNAILGEVRALQAKGVAVASLMRGEPDLSTPVHITDAAIEALRKGRTGYPDNRGEKRLREAVASRLPYDAGSEVLVTTGATFGIYAALMALLEPGDEVLLPDPVYDAYQSPVRLAGGVLRPVASTREGARFTIGVDALEAAWTPRARVLLLNTPWNPVGTVLRADELRAIAEFVTRRGLVLISDEIYETITYGAPHVSPLDAAPELRERLVIVNSLSKTYAMTGWRVGYCCAPAPLIDAMFLVLQQSSRGPATFIQDAAAAALTGPQDCVAEMRAEYARRREQTLDALTGIAGVDPLAPEGGFFAMVDVSGLGRPSNDIRRALLQDHRVAVVHGSAYGPRGEGTLRVSFGSGGAALAQGLERLRAGLSA